MRAPARVLVLFLLGLVLGLAFGAGSAASAEPELRGTGDLGVIIERASGRIQYQIRRICRRSAAGQRQLRPDLLKRLREPRGK